MFEDEWDYYDDGVKGNEMMENYDEVLNGGPINFEMSPERKAVYKVPRNVMSPNTVSDIIVI